MGLIETSIVLGLLIVSLCWLSLGIEREKKTGMQTIWHVKKQNVRTRNGIMERLLLLFIQFTVQNFFPLLAFCPLLDKYFYMTDKQSARSSISLIAVSFSLLHSHWCSWKAVVQDCIPRMSDQRCSYFRRRWSSAKSYKHYINWSHARFPASFSQTKKRQNTCMIDTGERHIIKRRPSSMKSRRVERDRGLWTILLLSFDRPPPGNPVPPLDLQHLTTF